MKNNKNTKITAKFQSMPIICIPYYKKLLRVQGADELPDENLLQLISTSDTILDIIFIYSECSVLDFQNYFDVNLLQAHKHNIIIVEISDCQGDFLLLQYQSSNILNTKKFICHSKLRSKQEWLTEKFIAKIVEELQFKLSNININLRDSQINILKNKSKKKNKNNGNKEKHEPDLSILELEFLTKRLTIGETYSFENFEDLIDEKKKLKKVHRDSAQTGVIDSGMSKSIDLCNTSKNSFKVSKSTKKYKKNCFSHLVILEKDNKHQLEGNGKLRVIGMELIELILFARGLIKIIQKEFNKYSIEVDLEAEEKIMFTQEHIFDVDENKYLGGGAFGSVYEGCLKSKPDEIIAVKRINDIRELLKKINEPCAEVMTTANIAKKKFDNEIEAFRVLERIKSPHVPEYYGTQFSKTKGEIYQLELGIEMCDGNLENYINKISRKLTYEECFCIFWQIVEGLHLLHANNIMHRDLKPKNILYKYVVYEHGKCNEEEKLTIWKIGDFGLAEIKEKVTLYAGTLIYMAPELRNRKEYDRSVDIWALGLVLHKLLFGYDYYNSANLGDNYILKKEEENAIGEDISNLLSGMMQNDPLNRFTIENIKEFQQKIYFNVNLMHKINEYDDKKQDGSESEAAKNLQKNIQNDKEAMAMMEDGKLWMSKRMFKKARSMFFRAESYYSKSERNKIFIASAYNDIGECYKNTYNYEEALNYYEKFLLIKTKQCEENSIKGANIYKKMGDQLQSLQKYDKAMDNYGKALKILVNICGANHPLTKILESNINRLLMILIQQIILSFEKALASQPRTVSKF